MEITKNSRKVIGIMGIQTVQSNYYSYKSDTYIEHKCDGCGCKFKVRTGEYIYTIDIHVPHAVKKLKFCSYNCRSRYKKRKEQEEQEKWRKGK